MSDGNTWILLVNDEEVERSDNLTHLLERANEYPDDDALIDVDLKGAICLF